MQKAGGIIAIIAGVLGTIAAIVTMFIGGMGAAFNLEGANTIVGLAWGGVLFSFLTIIFGAVTIAAKSKIPGMLLIVSAILGAILGGTLVAICMTLSLVGGILAVIGTKKSVIIQIPNVNVSTEPTEDSPHQKSESMLTNCKVCQKEVALTAPVCPHCGVKLRSNLARNLAISIGGVILIFALGAVIIGMHSERNNAATPTASKTTLTGIPEIPAQPEITGPKREFISETCPDVANTFSVSGGMTDLQKSEAWKRYGGKWVHWTGNVSSVDDKFGSLTVHIKCQGSTLVSDAIVYFDEKWKPELLALREGQQIQFEGRLSDYNQLFGIYIKQGELPTTDKPLRTAPSQSQAKCIIDDINAEKALMAIFGNFNPSKKVSVWKNIAPQKELESLGFSGVDGLVSTAFAQQFTEGGKEKYIIVTKTIPTEEDFRCHACAPIIGVTSFVRNNGKWSIETETRLVTASGSYGDIPAVTLIRLGNDKYGLRFDGSGGGMGYYVDYMFIVANQGGQFKQVIALKTREDASASCQPDQPKNECDWKYTVSIDQVKGNSSDFYDIRTFKVGSVKEEESDKVSEVNETSIYSFDPAKFEYSVSKRVAQPSYAHEMKNPQTISERVEPNANTTSVSISTKEVKIDYPSDATPLVVSMINSARDLANLDSIRTKLDQLGKPKEGDKIKARKLNDEALALMRQSKDAEAIPLLESAHRADPLDVEIANNLASAYYNTAFLNKDFSKAKSMLVETLRLKPDRSIAWANLARAFAMEGNEYAAANCYINFYRFSKNREKAVQLLSKGMNDPNPVLSKAYMDAYQYVSTNMSGQ